MVDVASELHCEQHHGLAGWECTVCHRALCPDCAALKFVPPVSLTACGVCGEFAEPLLRHRAHGAPFTSRIREAYLFPFRGEGPAVWFGIAMVLWLLSFAGDSAALIGWCATVGSLFGLIRSTARGHGGLELGDFQDVLQSIALPVARFAVAMLPAWGGALAAVITGKTWLWWPVVLITIAWTPTSLIAAATGTDLLHMLNPVRVLGTSARMGRDFALYATALSLTMVLWVVCLVASVFLRDLGVPLVASALAQVLVVYPPLVAARLAGAALFAHGSAFGLDPVDAYEPVLGDVQPRGALPEKTRTLPKHLPSVIELEPEAPVQQRAANRFEAVELSPHAAPPPEVAPLDVSLLPGHGEQAAADIRAAMRAGNADAALDGFRATGLLSAPSLTFEELLWLGQTAGARIDYESALLALEHAAAREAAPELRGRAWVMLGRLLGEKLSRRGDAVRWMERVVRETPNTAAASYAATWLSA